MADTTQRLAIIDQGQRHAVNGRAAMLAVRVVERGRTHAHLHIGLAHVIAGALGQRPILRAD